MNTTLSPVENQSPPARLLICARDSLSTAFQGCDHAQTLVGYSPSENGYLLIPLPCNQWSCRYCAEVKVRRLSAMTREAKPNRMVTLTVDPKLWENPRAAFDGTRRQIAPLFQALRKKFGEVEYLRVTELTSNGWPHYHLLVRSHYIPHAVICGKWRDLTGARIVDVRKVDKTWRAYNYLIKYLSKLHKIEWTERHVSYSRGFFPEPKKSDRPKLEIEKPQMIHAHPVTYCLEHELGRTLIKLNERVFKIVDENTNGEDF